MSSRPIITVPHATLRSTTQEITTVSEELKKLIADLEDTLLHQRNPKGVGLAAPQVNQPWQVFSTFLPEIDSDNDELPSFIATFINPRITKESYDVTFGGTEEQPALEGCLSIPKLYGPVPRREWVELEYETVVKDKLVGAKKRFEGFNARVIQHELDHLDGVLFTDYSLKYDLPVYQENPKNKKLEELESRSILEIF